MSQYPSPGGPLGYYAAPRNRRPTTVTVFAILAIIFGSLGTLGMLCSIPQQLGFRFTRNPVVEAMQKDTLLVAINLASHAIALALFITLLWSDIGALSLKPAARTAMLWYAKIDIVATILQIILSVTFIHSRTEAMTRKALLASPGINAASVDTLLKVTFYGGLALSAVILIWPILILYFMNKPHVKAAFDGSALAAPPAGYYPQ